MRASLGTSMFATVWLAVGFSLAAGVFWLASVCCCSGRSGSSARKREAGKDEEASRMQWGGKGRYQRVESPGGLAGQGIGKGQAVPMKDLGRGERGTAYEPFRYQGP